MSEKLLETIQSHLDPGEKVFWAGQPQQGMFLQVADFFLIPFSLMWSGFVFFWEYSVITMPDSHFFFALFGIPFVLVGCYVLFGRFFFDAFVRKHIFYAVTSERIILISGFFRQQVKSLNIRNLQEITLKESSNRRGSISFDSTLPLMNWMRGVYPMGGTAGAFQMNHIENAKSVYRLIRKLCAR